MKTLWLPLYYLRYQNEARTPYLCHNINSVIYAGVGLQGRPVDLVGGVNTGPETNAFLQAMERHRKVTALPAKVNAPSDVVG